MTSEQYKRNCYIFLDLTYSVSSLVPASWIEGIVLTLNSIYAEFNIQDFFFIRESYWTFSGKLAAEGTAESAA